MSTSTILTCGVSSFQAGCHSRSTLSSKNYSSSDKLTDIGPRIGVEVAESHISWWNFALSPFHDQNHWNIKISIVSQHKMILKLWLGGRWPFIYSFKEHWAFQFLTTFILHFWLLAPINVILLFQTCVLLCSSLSCHILSVMPASFMPSKPKRPSLLRLVS